MGAIRYLLRSWWRRGIGGQLVLAAVIAVSGATVLATLAGARRTETADDRFADAALVPDLLFSTSGFGPVAHSQDQIEAVRDLPMVLGSSQLRALALEPAGSGLYQPAAAPTDDHWGRDVAVTRYVEGRAPEGPNEMSMVEQRADVLGLSLGDTLTMASYSSEQIEAMQNGGDDAFGNPQGPTIDLTLVGIERTPQSLLTDRDIASVTMVAPSFVDEYGDQVGSWNEMLAVDLDGDADSIDEFTAAVREIPGLEEAGFEQDAGSGSSTGATVGFVALALRVVALLTALAGLVVVALLLTRSATASVADDAVLRGLGVGRRSRRRLHVAEAIPAATVGTVGALAGSIMLSPQFPFGLAGRAEPEPGVHVDGLVLSIGLMLILFCVGLTAWLASRRAEKLAAGPASRSPRSWFVGRIAAMGAPVSVFTGMRLVLERGSGGRGIPARLAIVGVAAGSAGLVAVLVFTGSQAHLENSPSMWGRTWDVVIPSDQSEVLEIVAAEDVVAHSQVKISTFEIGGVPTEVRSFTTIDGPSMVPIVQGRTPGPNEIALGATTMDDLGVDIGDRILLSGGAGEREVEVVGQTVMSGVTDAPQLATGAVVNPATFDEVYAEGADGEVDDLMKLGPDTDRSALVAELSPLLGEGTPEEDVKRIVLGDRPDEFDRLDEVRPLPWLLAGFLGLLAVTATVGLLVSAVGRRARDLAILRAAGLGGGGVRRILAVQAVTVSVIGLLIGVPAGVLIGREVWQLVAEDLGVAVDLVFPLVLVAATVLLVVLVDVVASLVPARRAVRSHPAEILRAE